MDVLQKEIDEVYATQLIADEILDNGVVEQHQGSSSNLVVISFLFRWFSSSSFLIL